ncbi:MAG: alkaline phosphatase family protein [Actinomycetota bacterium]
MSGRTPASLVVLVDALRHDYLELGDTPFLSDLRESGRALPLRTILGYSDSVRATAFTGLMPDELGYWMEYRFRPGRSPFAPFDRLRWLDRFPSDLALRGGKLILSRTFVPRLARRRGYPSLDLRNLPFGAMWFFDYTIREPMTAPGALGAPTIFDRLSAADRPWVYLDSSKVGDRGIFHGIASAPEDTALLFVYLHHLDMASHLFGIDGARFRTTLRETDRRVERISTSVRKRFGDVQTLVFSDHGMSPATSFRSLPELRRHRAFGSGFCFALDATMVRIWYVDRRTALRTELRDLVASRLDGRWLTLEDRRSFSIDFEERDYGDEIFLVEPGQVIFPNFHSYVRPKAMHAYDPGDPDQAGIVLASSGVGVPERPQMTDISSAMSRMTGLPSLRPLERIGFLTAEERYAEANR